MEANIAPNFPEASYEQMSKKLNLKRNENQVINADSSTFFFLILSNLCTSDIQQNPIEYRNDLQVTSMKYNWFSKLFIIWG